MTSKVFVNRILNLKKIKALGLDLDHTLVRYNTERFESLVYSLLLNLLVQDKGYPEKIKELKFDFSKAIRGLVVDRKRGNILKLSRFGAIRNSQHGTEPIPFAEQKKIYRSHYVDLSDPDYMPIDTSFSISFCVLYGQLVDLADQTPKDFPRYDEIANDINHVTDLIHKDGSLKKIVLSDLDSYILKEKAVVDGLQRFRKHGKKIFVVTNSEYYYAKKLLEFAIDPFLEGETWSDLFDIVVTSSRKPRFFFDDSHFLEIQKDDGTMTNLDGPIGPGIYQGGHARKFTSDLGLSGDEILYIGDHIYGDILRLKKDCNWRTALVVEELGDEIESQTKAYPVTDRISDLMKKKEPLEAQHVDLLSKKIEENSDSYNDEISALQKQIAKIDQEASELIQEQQSYFNKTWGRIFRAGAEESLFASQVDRYACIYMTKLSDLLQYSPRTYFRAPFKELAHEMD